MPEFAPDLPSSALRLLTTAGEVLERLVYTNERHSSFEHQPDRFLVSVDLAEIRAVYPGLDGLMLELPESWVTDLPRWHALTPEVAACSWTVYPRGRPDSYQPEVAVTFLRGHESFLRVRLVVPLEIRGLNQFEPSRHGLPVANRASVLGEVGPSETIFRRTYRLSVLPRAFFQGLYGSIAFIGARRADYRGGFCTGMARAALERSLDERATSPAIEDVILWHGRQLTDRALLASAPWFLFPSPSRAFRRFRDDVLSTGRSDVCFDIGVPKPWRRDVFKALTREGHTVVPYAFSQGTDDQSLVLVYDPNFPFNPAESPSVVSFDLKADRYGYRSLASLDEGSSTVVAVRQRAYRNGQTAILASLANLLLYPKSLRSTPVGVGLVGLALVAALTGALTVRRRSGRD